MIFNPLVNMNTDAEDKYDTADVTLASQPKWNVMFIIISARTQTIV